MAIETAKEMTVVVGERGEQTHWLIGKHGSSFIGESNYDMLVGFKTRQEQLACQQKLGITTEAEMRAEIARIAKEEIVIKRIAKSEMTADERRKQRTERRKR